MAQSQFVGDLELSINHTSAKSPTGESLAALLVRAAGGREPRLRHSKTLHDLKAGSGTGHSNARCERSVMRRSDRLDLGDAEADGKPDMTRRLVAMATAAALLAFSAAPSFADHHGGGHGGGSRGWHGGGGN